MANSFVRDFSAPEIGHDGSERLDKLGRGTTARRDRLFVTAGQATETVVAVVWS